MPGRLRWNPGLCLMATPYLSPVDPHIPLSLAGRMDRFQSNVVKHQIMTSFALMELLGLELRHFMIQRINYDHLVSEAT